MATTRIMPLHIGKGRTESRAICWRREIATIFCREYLTNFYRKSRRPASSIVRKKGSCKIKS